MPGCSLCLKLNFISLSILFLSNVLCFALFLLFFEKKIITFGCGFDKLISLVENRVPVHPRKYTCNWCI